LKRRTQANGRSQSVCFVSRAQGLRAGTLHDITASARACARLDLATAITHRLWETLAPGEPFRANDRRVKEICYALGFARVGAIPAELFDKAGGQALRFEFQRGEQHLSLIAVVYPTEELTLVCTIMRSDED
jgi:hypothetical protein